MQINLGQPGEMCAGVCVNLQVLVILGGDLAVVSLCLPDGFSRVVVRSGWAALVTGQG